MTAFFACLTLLEPAALADSVVLGVWVGAEQGAANAVVLRLEAPDRFVYSDRAVLGVGTWRIGKQAPGDNGTMLEMEVDITFRRMLTLDGSDIKLPPDPTSRASAAHKGDKLRVCATLPGSGARRPELGAAMQPKGVVCLDLTRPQASYTDAERTACLDRCIRESMPRAVAPEVIAADCRASCSVLAP